MKEMQENQLKFDEKYWQHNSSELEKVRHITLHLTKTLGKLATFVERKDHGDDYSHDQVKTEVIPDLVFHALQLGNLYDVDALKAYDDRIKELKERFDM